VAVSKEATALFILKIRFIVYQLPIAQNSDKSFSVAPSGKAVCWESSEKHIFS